jgi:hypothetical protein
MKEKLAPHPSMYQRYVGVHFKDLPLLWQLIENGKESIFALTDFKSRRHFKKKMAVDFRGQKLTASKYAERNIKNEMSEKEVKKAIDELNVYVGNYLESLAVKLANHTFNRAMINTFKTQRDEYKQFSKKNKGKLTRREINKEFRQMHPDISASTIRGWY